MSTLEVNKITPVSGGTTVQVGESGDTINIPAGATIANAGTSTGFGITAANFLPNANPLIINGSMNVAQRATQVTGYTSISYSTCDRWYTVCEIGTYTISQESLSDADFNTTGFRKALKLDCTTIEAPPSAGAQTNVEMRFEGQDLQVFQKGTANAKKYTLSFWVRASKTGSNLQVNFKDNDNTRMCSGTYNISSANTWEKKIINIAADTTGKFDNDNASSLTIEWFLDGGSNYSGLGGSTSNDWAITGVQLEVGEYTSSTIPPFQHESYGDNLQRCLRYFQAPIYNKDSQGSNEEYAVFGTGVYTASGYFRCVRPLPVEMRVNPSLVSSSGTNYFFISSGANDDLNDLTLFADSNYKTAFVYNNDEASGTAGQAGNLMGNNASAYAWLNAEL